MGCDSAYSVGLLNSWAVRDWVGEGHSELDEVCTCQLIGFEASGECEHASRTCATGLHSEHDVGRILWSWVSRRHIRDKSRLRPYSAFVFRGIV